VNKLMGREIIAANSGDEERAHDGVIDPAASVLSIAHVKDVKNVSRIQCLQPFFTTTHMRDAEGDQRQDAAAEVTSSRQAITRLAPS